ncbi:hypothetical protein ACNKHM_08830 [Shigella sonnei]
MDRRRPANASHYCGADVLLFWLLTRKTALGRLSKPLVSTFGRQKMPGKHADYRHAHCRVERAMCGDCGHYRGGGYSRCRCQQCRIMAGSWTRFLQWRLAAIADGRRLNLPLSVVGADYSGNENTGFCFLAFRRR